MNTFHSLDHFSCIFDSEHSVGALDTEDYYWQYRYWQLVTQFKEKGTKRITGTVYSAIQRTIDASPALRFGEKDRGLSTCKPWSEQAGGLDSIMHEAAQDFEVF